MEVTDDEVRNAIMNSAPSKATVPDGMGFKCIQEAYASSAGQCNSFYRAAIKVGYHLACWHEATIAVIRKPNKPDYMTPNAYRPVSFLNCLGKISEKIATTRLAFMAEKHHLLHRWRIGGRPNRSAVDACLTIASIADEARHKKLITSTHCMDVKGEFDNVYLKRL